MATKKSKPKQEYYKHDTFFALFEYVEQSGATNKKSVLKFNDEGYENPNAFYDWVVSIQMELDKRQIDSNKMFYTLIDCKIIKHN